MEQLTTDDHFRKCNSVNHSRPGEPHCLGGQRERNRNQYRGGDVRTGYLHYRAGAYCPGGSSTLHTSRGPVGTYYSQSLYASGGTAPYTWSLLSGTLPAGLTISSTGVISGTPTAAGTATFTANVMDTVGANALQIFSFPVGTTQSFTSAQRIPQIVDGGGWKTRFIITNTDQLPATYTFQFWSQNGSTLALPILNGTAGVLTGTVAPGASVFAQTPGTSPTLQQGWAEVASSNRIRVTAFYQYQVGGSRDSIGTVAATQSGNNIVMPFDNTQGNVTPATTTRICSRPTASPSACRARAIRGITRRANHS